MPTNSVPSRLPNATDRGNRPASRDRRAQRAVQRQSHAESVYDALKRDILSGALPPGATLREEELARRHDVSRTPVREALGRLESEGLASRHQGSGLLVSEVGSDEIIDLYVLREVLEGLAARIVASRRTEIDLARLEVLSNLAQQAVKDGDNARAASMNAEFHFLIWRIAGNRPLLRAINGVHEAVQRFPHNTLTYPGRLAQSTQEHAQILEAIRNRDDVAAERIAIEHVRHTRNIRIAMTLEHDHQLNTNHAHALD